MLCLLNTAVGTCTIRRFLVLAVALAFGGATGVSQVISGAADTLAEGRRLVAQLRLDLQTDTPLFAAIGHDRAQALLQAVLDRGQQSTATSEDWKNLHCAVEGLTELAVANGEPFRGAIYQLLQDNFYAQFEADYTKGLDAARRSLALQEQSGVTNTLCLPHSAIGRDLAALGRTEEALAEYRAAVQLDTDPMNASAAQRSRDVVQAEISLGRMEDARRDQEALWQTAQRADGLFRARALLARADVELAGGAAREAADTVVEAGKLVTDLAAKSGFEIDAINLLMVAVLDWVNAASYGDALSLANHIAQAMPGLPVDMPAFARRATLVRRRNAGDLDGVLRDLSESLSGAQLRNDVPAQIDALNGIAATYGALHARTQRVAALEEALALQPAAPTGYSEAYLLVNTLNNLGAAYADLGDERASARFSQTLKTIGSLSAGDQSRLESAASEARVGQARAAEIDQDIDTARDLLQAESKRHPESASAALAWARLEPDSRDHNPKAGELYERAIGLFRDQKQVQAEIAIRLEYARYLAGDGQTRVANAAGKAHAQTDSAASALHTIEYAEGQWQLAYTRGVLAEGDNNPAAAIDAYRAAIDILERLRSAIGDAGRRQAFSDSRLMQDLYSRLVSLYASRQQVANAWEYVERQKARAFLETLSGHAPADAAANSPEWQEAKKIEEQVASLRTALSVPETVLRGAGRSPAVIRIQLTALETHYSEARERATMSSSASALDPAVPPPSLERIRAALPLNAALVEYAILPGKLAAFTVTRSDVKMRTWPGTEAALESKSVRLWRALKTDQAPGLKTPRAHCPNSSSTRSPPRPASRRQAPDPGTHCVAAADSVPMPAPAGRRLCGRSLRGKLPSQRWSISASLGAGINRQRAVTRGHPLACLPKGRSRCPELTAGSGRGSPRWDPHARQLREAEFGRMTRRSAALAVTIGSQLRHAWPARSGARAHLLQRLPHQPGAGADLARVAACG